MTTSQKNSILSSVIGDEPIPRRTLVYFRSRLSNRIHELVLEEFARLEEAGKITRAELGRRIGREPAQITRWLGSPGNWTTDTCSDLLLGMRCEPALSISRLDESQAKESSAADISASEQVKPKPRLIVVPNVSSATNAASGNSMFPSKLGELGDRPWEAQA